MTIENYTDREIALQDRVAALEAQIEASRKQMESQKDEWLSWSEKRTAPMPSDSEFDEDEDYRAVYKAMLAAALKNKA